MTNGSNKVLKEWTELFTEEPINHKKKFQNEAYEKYLGKFSPYIHLWNLSDKEWVKYRKEVWDKIIEREKQENSDFVKSYWESEERFFLRGKPRKSDNEIYPERMMAYIPFSSVEQIREMFDSIHISNKANLHSNLLTKANSIYRAAPDEFHRVELIVKALYSKEHVAKKEILGTRERLVVKCPSDFVVGYISEAVNYIKRGDSHYLNELRSRKFSNYTGSERSYVEITHDFFLGSLEHALDDKFTDFKECLREDSIVGLKNLIEVITNYNSDIPNVNRDKFIEKSRALLLNNSSVKKVLMM